MLLRNSISTTKKFFEKTVQSFKSFFSSDHYQKLPKNPTDSSPYSSFTCGINDMKVQTNFVNDVKDLNSFYNIDFTERWDDTDHREKSKSRDKKKKISEPSSSSTKQERDDHDLNSSFMKFSKPTAVKNFQHLRRRDEDYTFDDPKYKSAYARKRAQLDDNSSEAGNGRSFLVAQKLKELEMMDVSNVEHVLDIEEVLHYYSRLTCPAYLDIVDNFFMNVYAEFFAPPVTPLCVNSRPRLRSVMS